MSVPSSNGSANLAKHISLVYDDPELSLQLDEISEHFSQRIFSLDLRASIAIACRKTGHFRKIAQAHTFFILVPSRRHARVSRMIALGRTRALAHVHAEETKDELVISPNEIRRTRMTL